MSREKERLPCPTALGIFLRDRRLCAGLTLDQFAEQAGVSASTVWKLETGAQRSVHAPTRRKIAQALDVDEERLGEMEFALPSPPDDLDLDAILAEPVEYVSPERMEELVKAAREARAPQADVTRRMEVALRTAPAEEWPDIIGSATRLGRRGLEALTEALLRTIRDPDEREWLRKCIEKARAA